MTLFRFIVQQQLIKTNTIKLVVKETNLLPVSVYSVLKSTEQCITFTCITVKVFHLCYKPSQVSQRSGPCLKWELFMCPFFPLPLNCEKQ